VARELTKIHEEAVRGTLPEIAAVFRARRRGRGEVTVVVEGSMAAASGKPEVSPAADADLNVKIAAALAAGRSKRSIARELASKSGRTAREIYARAVAIGRGEPK
jgi:16S rRNA (cytidine1402-2'-O)-methyltransferase